MKKAFFGTIMALFIGIRPAAALPTCAAQPSGAKFISRWQKEGDAWQFSFTCDDYREAKIYAEDVVEPSDTEAAFFVVDENGMPESQDIFDSPCDAVKAYCTGTIHLLPPEVKQALIDHLSQKTP